MRRIVKSVISLLATSVLAFSCAHAKSPILTVRLKNDTGIPVSDARVGALVKTGLGYTMNCEGIETETGVYTIDAPEFGAPEIEAWQLVASARGYGFALLDGTETGEKSSVDITMPMGQEVIIRITTPGFTSIPDETFLAIYTPDLAGYAWWAHFPRGVDRATYQNLASLAYFDRTGPSEFTTTLPPDFNTLYMLMDAPGLIEFHEIGPITPESIVDGVLSIDIPKPGGLRVAFEFQGGTMERPSSCLLERTLKHPEREAGWLVRLDARSATASPSEFVWDALSAAQYKVTCVDGAIRPENSHLDEEMAHVAERVTIESGKVHPLSLSLEPFDSSTLAGEYTAVVTINRADGSPAVGVECTASHHRDGRTTTVGTGISSDLSQVEFPQLAAGKDFDLRVGNIQLGEFQIAESSEKRQEYVFSLPPMSGDTAPDVAITRIPDGEIMRISDFRGQVVFVDFWATWCGPCQDPMAKNQKIMSRRATDWAGKATILAISCDNTREVLQTHIETRGWTDVPHFIAEEGGHGWDSKAMRAYGITGVPTAFLIDQHGKIVWRGHPGSYPVEERIDDLIQRVP